MTNPSSLAPVPIRRSITVALILATSVVGALAGLGAAGLSSGAGGGRDATDLAALGSRPPTSPARIDSTTTAVPAPTSAVPDLILPPSEPEGSLPAPATSGLPDESTSSLAPAPVVSTTLVSPTTPTLPAPTTGVPTTTIRTTTTTQTLPALLSLSYLQDANGALVVKPRGSATVTIVNNGGQSGQWFLSSGAPSILAMSATSGTLAPGGSFTITVTDIGGTPFTSAITGVVAPNVRINIKVTVK